jgi:hypothetical protein
MSGSLAFQLWRAARRFELDPTTGVVEEAATAVLGTLGVSSRSLPLDTVVDDGPVVKFHALSVCCVLNRGPAPHACPGCPCWTSRTERAEQIAFFVRAMGNDDFEKVCGRPRVAVRPSG